MGGLWIWLSLVLVASSRPRAAAPPVLPEVASREVEVTAAIGDVGAPDRGLVALSDGSGAATILVREAGHLRAQRSSDGGATFLPEVEVSTPSSRPVLDHRAVLTPDGVVVAAWSAPDPAGDRAIYLSRSSDHGATWTVPVAVVHAAISGHGAQHFQLAVGASGRAAITWVNGASQSVHVRVTQDGLTWLPAVVVAPGPLVADVDVQSLDLGLGPRGEVHLAFVHTGPGFSRRIFTSRSMDGGGTFESPTDRTSLYPVLSPRPFNADLEVDDDGTVLVAAVLSGRLGLLRSTDAGSTFVGSDPVTIQGSQTSVTPLLTSWQGTSLVALRCVEGQARLVVALSTDGGETFQQRRLIGAAQPGPLGNALLRTPTGRILVAWIDRGLESQFPPSWDSQVFVSSTLDGTTWTSARADSHPGKFQGAVSAALSVGADGQLTVLWEDPRPDPGTTSIWKATASEETLQFGNAAPVDTDAFRSRPNASSDPTVASDGDRHVLAVFPAATRSPLNDVYVAASADGGRTFGSPLLLGNEPPGVVNHFAPAAALSPEGVGWVVSNSPFGLRLHRTADFGASFPEAPIELGFPPYEGLLHVTAAAGGFGLAAWADGYPQAWIARGGGPGTPVTHTMLATNSWDATVCADGARVTVAYAHGGGIGARRSADSGETFGPASVLAQFPRYMAAACGLDEAAVVWFDEDAAQIRASVIGPPGWGAVSVLGPASFANPRVTRSGDHVVAAWYENGAIWIVHSADGGETWDAAERLDSPLPGENRDPFSWNVVLGSDTGGRIWAFWEEERGAAPSVVLRRSDDGGSTWGAMRRLSREQPQHAFQRQDFPNNARPGVVPGAALLAYAGPLTSDWRSVFVNADDALDADRDGVPDAEDCAPQDPDTHTCGGPPVAEAGSDLTMECTGDLSALVHLDGTESTDPDGDLASFVWTEGEVTLAKTATADVALALGSHTLTLRVTDATGASDTDTVQVEIADTQPPTGGITFPEAGACYGPAQLPVVLADDAADVCDPAPTSTTSPSASFETHGDHAATLHVQDAAGLVLESAVSFTIDTVPPSARFTSTSGRIDPGHLPLALAVMGQDDDGAAGSVVRERLLLGDCVLLDGISEGDGDGLLSDEALSLSLGDLCAAAGRCGFALLSDPELRLEAVDCGGNVGDAIVRLEGAFPAQGVCRSPRATRPDPRRGMVSLQPR